MVGCNGLIGLQDRIKPSSEIHPATRKLILGPWDALAEEIGVPPGARQFAGLAVKSMEQSESVADSGREFKGCKTISIGDRGRAYLLVSALHKSVRFGLEKEAVLYYRSLVEGGRDAHADSYVRNTILYENVGLGDPVLCEVIRRAFGKAAKSSEDVRLHLIRLACRANKSRLQTDVWQQLTYRDVGRERLLEAAGLNVEDAAESLVAGRMTSAEAIAFGWVLLGKGGNERLLARGQSAAQAIRPNATRAPSNGST